MRVKDLYCLSLVAQRLKHLPAMRETWVGSLGREDPLEKEMATHSSILAWRIPWTEELGGLQSMGCKESDTTEQLHFHCSLIILFLSEKLLTLIPYLSINPSRNRILIPSNLTKNARNCFFLRHKPKIWEER